MKLNWNEYCWKGTRTVGNQGKYSEVCKSRPHAADIQPFAATEFQVGRKQYQKCKGSSWTKGQRPVNWNTRIWTTSVTWRWGWNETLLLMAPPRPCIREKYDCKLLFCSEAVLTAPIWQRWTFPQLCGGGGMMSGLRDSCLLNFEIAACSTSR